MRSASSRVKSGGMCCTITTGTGNCAARPGSIAASALGPPVETPIATTSIRLGPVVEAVAGSDGRRRGFVAGTVGRRHSPLIFGTRSSRMRCIAAWTLPTLAGLVT